MKTPAMAVLLVGLAALCGLAADEPKKDAPIIVIDAAGKENKVKDWKIVAGTRHLSWLAPAPAPEPKGEPKEKEKVKAPAPPAGPEALVFREDNSTTFAAGIITYIPLERIQAIDYDNDPGQQLVTVKVAGAKPDQATELKGTTRYVGVNKLTIEADVDKGDLGVASIKYQGGVKESGIKGIRFPNPKGAAAPEGKASTIVAADKMSTKHEVYDLQALYRAADGRLLTLPYIMFKKTVKIDLAKAKTLKFKDDPKTGEAEGDVTLDNGETLTLSLLRTITVDDKPLQLEGLVGKVPAGYKLFPVHTITELTVGK